MGEKDVAAVGVDGSVDRPSNPIMLQGFSWYLPSDGTHWRRVAALAPMLASLGVTSVWLPPAYKGQAGANDVGYGVYDLYDLGEFDQKGSVRTKYGTRAEYEAAIEALHAAGIKVIVDVVLNHRMGADATEEVRATRVSEADRCEGVSGEETIEAWTRFTFPGRAGAYSDFTWDWRCFHGTDWDERTHQKGIWLFEGKHWDRAVEREENGNYDYLMGADVDVNYPPVFTELARWGAWYLGVTGADGLRLDALKHLDRDFFLRWVSEMRAFAAVRGRELFCVGEYWAKEDADDLADYLGDGRMMSLFDVPLHYALFRASSSMGAEDLSQLFSESLAAADPERAVTFVENHDTQPNQALQSSVQAWFKPAAYALILLRRAGLPCVFFGDLFGMPHDGGLPPVAELPLLMWLRERAAWGEERSWFDGHDLVGWTRSGDAGRPASGVAVLLTDATGGEKTLWVGAEHAGETWRCVLGSQADVVVGKDGSLACAVAGGGLSVYVPEALADELAADKGLAEVVRRAATGEYLERDPAEL